MPAEKRKKSTTPEAVPMVGDPDRKRVLNVLAQRRYRQRRREKIAALEAQAKGLTPPQSLDGYHESGEQSEPQGPAAPTTESPSDESVDIEEVFRVPEDEDFTLFALNNDSPDMQLFQGDFNFFNLPSPIPSTPPSPNVNPLTQPTSTTSPLPINFPLTLDGGQLEVPILSTLRAFSNIAIALDVIGHVYNPFYLHTLPATPPPNLPSNLYPTAAQITIPHHPLLDTLPWPSIREKLICILSLPSILRPCIAQDEEGDGQGQGKAVTRLIQDLDAFKDGVRVHGNLVGWGEGSELAEEAWEVGEAFYRNWWWCMDGRVIEMTNRLRKNRGLGKLRLQEV